MTLPKKLLLILIFIAMIGLADSAYLTAIHYFDDPQNCSVGNCSAVLGSEYSRILGIPTALLGVIFYIISGIILGFIYSGSSRFLSVLATTFFFGGLSFSLYLTYIQFFILKSLCPYCLLSGIATFFLFILKLKFDRIKK